jgi:hypothetical protein
VLTAASKLSKIGIEVDVYGIAGGRFWLSKPAEREGDSGTSETLLQGVKR